MKKELIRSFLEAFAVGDAYGKATEYCSLEQVQAHYSRIDELLPPEKAIAHQDLFYGQVTDDTEQNVYLLREYARQGRVTPYDTAMCLLRWVQETDAATKYIGPNSLKALRAIEQGADVTTAGTGGTTCGGMMRAPVAFLFSTPDTLTQNVVTCLMPTHNTSVAIEAAMCYAYALQAAAVGKSLEQILDSACEGAQIGKGFGSTHRVAGVAPSCAARLRFLQKVIPTLQNEQQVKEFLYGVIGATLASADVCACSFGLFLYAQKDTALAIRLATEMGGDSDTIACLAAGLCTLYAGGHNLPHSMIELVEKANHLDFAVLADTVVTARKSMKGAGEA